MDFNIKTIKKQMDQHDITVDLNDARNSLSVLQFDKEFTFKMFKNVNPDEYYHELSCENYLHNVKSPILFINSKNDPISK
jgi:predicted alpha/beta-fold hydrolase